MFLVLILSQWSLNLICPQSHLTTLKKANLFSKAIMSIFLGFPILKDRAPTHLSCWNIVRNGSSLSSPFPSIFNQVESWNFSFLDLLTVFFLFSLCRPSNLLNLTASCFSFFCRCKLSLFSRKSPRLFKWGNYKKTSVVLTSRGQSWQRGMTKITWEDHQGYQNIKRLRKKAFNQAKTNINVVNRIMIYFQLG